MRGQIIYENRKKQIVDYSGVCYKNNITPTDIDGFFEIQRKVFIFIELKMKGKPIALGQKMALERIADCLKKPALVIIAEHETVDPEKK